jgi:GMP synthase (glutamine-hydrolysing)
MQHVNKNNKKVWAIMHATHEDLGSFEFILRSYGIFPLPILVKNTDIKTLNPADADLVFILGGAMGVYEADQYPHLHDEIKFIQERIALGKPTIGICLGAQIIAYAMGAKVYKGHKKELGWKTIQITEAGLLSPLRHFSHDQGPVMQWHGDTFELPQGALRLASSADYENQAFSFGGHVLALQFHPEVTELKLERWYQCEAKDIMEAGTTADILRTDAHRHGDALKQRNRRFLTEWLQDVAPHLLEKPVC